MRDVHAHLESLTNSLLSLWYQDLRNDLTGNGTKISKNAYDSSSKWRRSVRRYHQWQDRLKVFHSKQHPKNIGMQIFTLICFGQMISLIGSGLTNFALGVWVYQQTGSVTQFSLISLFISLPMILISPIAGTMVDQFPRRWMMVFSDLGAGIATGVIAFLFAADNLTFWHICAYVTISSCFSAFQLPAYMSAATLLVPEQDLARANGLLQVAEGVGSLVGPMLGGVLLLIIGINGIIFIDFATFIFALSILLLVPFPKQYIDRHRAEKTPWFKEASYGLVYLVKRRGLFALLLFFAINNFLVGIVQMLFTPLVLSFASATDLGTILTIGGVGMLVSSVLIITMKMPPYLIISIFAFKLLGGISIMYAGLYKSVPLLALIAFFFFFGLPIIKSSTQIIFQKKVPFNVQGRVFATIGAISSASQPLAYTVAGPLADKIFEPLVTPNGLLAGSIGKIIGVGQGRGIGLMFILMGILTVLATIIAYQYKPLRLLEKQLPDALA
ncbi:MAG: MFS transporter [Nostoc sp. DedSLP03]|uniref:MFS transporter n=1 Tax=Nostoc sp. DedSLP03 TaxID=3075400 RepID=UPI002AD2B3EE|nr:MFS transporter [Nostoc sp. DedSLP03]MDZ7963723.1 MFS transporter [Nostoc sp. DedSLP03]